MSKSENPPAFPSACLNDPGHPNSASGMSLRDWFAGRLAAAEVASAGANLDAAEALAEAADIAGQTIPERIAFNAYQVADAMLAEREKGGAA
jgi:hypothetical protein